MEHFDLSVNGDQWNIQNLPDGAKVASIDGELSSRLSDLALHLADLRFAWETLEALNAPVYLPQGLLIQEAMWRSAIVHFMKCFGGGARFSLNEKAVFKGAPPEAQEAFVYIKALRNKHVVHDENSYSQALPGLVFTDGTKLGYRVFKVVTLTVRAETIEDANVSNLRALVKDALRWVEEQYENLCKRITVQYEAMSFETLSALPQIKYRVPMLEEVQSTRPSIGKRPKDRDEPPIV